jgi:hypothetical protein
MKRVEEDEKEREVLRIVSRKTRERIMEVEDMIEDTSPAGKAEIVSCCTYCLTRIQGTLLY